MSCVCGCYCCDLVAWSQPVSSSGPAICAAQDATVGSTCTLNSLVGAGLRGLCAVLGSKTKVAVTSVKAQAQVATSASRAVIWIVVGVIALLAVIFYSQTKK